MPRREPRVEYRYLTEFQSHEPEVSGSLSLTPSSPERVDASVQLPSSIASCRTHPIGLTWLCLWGCDQFDYLKSLEIGEKINKIRWCPGVNGAHLLLSTNGALPQWESFVCVRSCHRGSCPGGNCSFGGAVECWRVQEVSLRGSSSEGTESP